MNNDILSVIPSKSFQNNEDFCFNLAHCQSITSNVYQKMKDIKAPIKSFKIINILQITADTKDKKVK